ncbi:hypothetical protein CWI38_0187p0060 [Hamiltosporidium tvaerminnensis]|uniref:Uncharacterized protein n=1 Tax=Hamiltosporidium tvaerminnensis TaxID=1176355 RepID=A0A4Q9M1K3_9MICR|nr:hypothetical protein CWI38_0187p0060 [Hamiltosporidium tvaerminnensis]
MPHSLLDILTTTLLKTGNKEEIVSVINKKLQEISSVTNRWEDQNNMSEDEYDKIFCQILKLEEEYERVSVSDTSKWLKKENIRRHNKVVRHFPLPLLNRYKFKFSKRIKSHTVKILYNEYTEIRVDTRIKTKVNILDIRLIN